MNLIGYHCETKINCWQLGKVCECKEKIWVWKEEISLRKSEGIMIRFGPLVDESKKIQKSKSETKIHIHVHVSDVHT